MNPRKLRFLRSLTGASAVLFLLIAVAVSVIIAIAEQPLNWTLSRTGFENMWVLFHIPITLAVTAFAVFASWLTVVRIEQSDRSLELTVRKNDFDNYYKHLDEFIKHLSDDAAVQYFHTLTEVERRVAIANCHRQYYTDNFTSFDPRINSETLRSLEAFHGQLVTVFGKDESTSFENASIEELTTCWRLIDNFAKELVTPIVNSHEMHARFHPSITSLPPELAEERIRRLKLLDAIYWSHAFHASVLAFDGIMLRPPLSLASRYAQFMSNYGFGKKGPA